MSRSSADLSQCSPKGVQPMPTIATWSQIPLDAISARSFVRVADRPRLPEIVLHPADFVQPPERHLDAVADAHAAGVDVGQLALEAAAAVEVEHGYDHRRV